LLCGIFKVVNAGLLALARAAGVTLLGVADISDLALDGFPRALSLAIAYPKKTVEHLAREVLEFHGKLEETRTLVAGALEQCARFLLARGYRVRVPAISENLPGLVGEFSHKTAATKAGLGWIGKNALLVVPGYGCGFRLGSLLTDAPLVPGKPILESRCGTCGACVEACPYGAIQGRNWYPGIARDELLAATVCHEQREAYREALGFKHPCGLCIQACPQDTRL
jgi:epoxyqueuosine reductase